jgi:hypothetical protein
MIFTALKQDGIPLESCGPNWAFFRRGDTTWFVGYLIPDAVLTVYCNAENGIKIPLSDPSCFEKVGRYIYSHNPAAREWV